MKKTHMEKSGTERSCSEIKQNRNMQRTGSGKGIMAACMIAVGLTTVAPGAAISAAAAEVPGQISVKFERFYTGNSQEYAVLEGVDADGSIVWTYETGVYDLAQLDSVTEIGARDGKYHFCENGTITALALDTGELLWSNGDFGGSVIDWLFDEQGNLYVCGYLGPDLLALTPEGNTMKYIGMASEELYWPYDLEWFDETTIEITYEGGGLDQEAPESLYIDVSDATEELSTEKKSEIVTGAVENNQNEYREVNAEDLLYGEGISEYSVEEETYYVVNCRESITLRTNPSVYAAEICQMPLGSAVDFLGIAENGFYWVEYNGQTGYALASYLMFI